jgi:hypothetical protein
MYLNKTHLQTRAVLWVGVRFRIRTIDVKRNDRRYKSRCGRNVYVFLCVIARHLLVRNGE